jgi:exodeoxyribonuclease V beta subunit
VRYLFLRGMDGSGKGVWAWDIDAADLAAWL